jgi:hypothetical protein
MSTKRILHLDTARSIGLKQIIPQLRFTYTNMMAKMDDPNSLLNHYRALIQLRGKHPGQRTGMFDSLLEHYRIDSIA